MITTTITTIKSYLFIFNVKMTLPNLTNVLVSYEPCPFNFQDTNNTHLFTKHIYVACYNIV